MSLQISEVPVSESAQKKQAKKTREGLKQCPFCKSLNVGMDIFGGQKYAGTCLNEECGATGPEALSYEVAREKWNKGAWGQ